MVDRACRAFFGCASLLECVPEAVCVHVAGACLTTLFVQTFMKPRVERVGRRNQVNPPNTHRRRTHGLQQRPNRQTPNVRILHSGPRRTGKALRVARLKPMTLQIKTSTSINTLKDTKPYVKSKVWPPNP